MEVVEVTLMKRRLPLLLVVTRFSSGCSSRHGGLRRVEVVVGDDGVDPHAAPATDPGSTELVLDESLGLNQRLDHFTASRVKKGLSCVCLSRT